MANEKTNKKEVPLTVGDFVIINPAGPLTRETYGTAVGLLCVVLPNSGAPLAPGSQAKPGLWLSPGSTNEETPEVRGQVLFASTLATVDLAHVLKMNY